MVYEPIFIFYLKNNSNGTKIQKDFPPSLNVKLRVTQRMVQSEGNPAVEIFSTLTS